LKKKKKKKKWLLDHYAMKTRCRTKLKNFAKCYRAAVLEKKK
jgi:hypothetical protein